MRGTVGKEPNGSGTGFLGRAAACLLLQAALLGGPPALQAGPYGGEVGKASTDPGVAFPSGGPGLDSTITVIRGQSAVLDHPATLERVSIADPAVADAVVVSAREVVVNGKAVGSTSLLVWDATGARARYTVLVTADGQSLERELARLFPDEEIEVTATGRTLVLSGVVRNAGVAAKALELAARWDEGAEVLDNIEVPRLGQVLLQVRFAEVNRSALKELGVNLLRVDPDNVRGDDEAASGAGGAVPFGEDFLEQDGPEQTFSDAVNFFLFHRSSNVAALVQALKTKGLLKSLAEPNLLAVPGEEASFLAGGEFPVPILQGGAAANAVTIQFKEFGIRLNFVPAITNSGAIRLRVAPEVSSLDFANAVQTAGFQIPALLARRAETVIELDSGQTFAIAGLIDSSLQKTVNKVPVLGDIPVLGALFRSEDLRQNRSELLVLVTPHIVHPLDTAPPIPTGEPEEWGLDKTIGDSIQRLPLPDSAAGRSDGEPKGGRP